jgi:pyruvate/2-oxoglutarate dehydrogenase complex dihydrolipoamide dehydrogenase (E3) component
MADRHFDALVIGSGEGGKYLAWHLARSGQRVAVVERRWIGGSCPNIACLPSKNEIWSAHVARLVRHAAEYGAMTKPVGIDMAAVRARKRAMVDGLVAMHLDLYRDSGAELVMGEARFTGERAVEVTLNDGGVTTFTTDKLFLNLGTHAAIPDVPGLVAARTLTHVEALELDRVPGHLVVLGGGYVGLELAQAFRRFGAKVTILEAGPQIAGREDPDIAEALLAILRAEEIAVHLDARLHAVSGLSGEHVVVEADTPAGPLRLEATDILAATGRVPNTAGIGLEDAGVVLTERGLVAVNERLETSAPNTWAIGECAGTPAFTHASFDDFRVIRDNLAGGSHGTRGRLIPYALFTDPPLGRVGLSETEAARQGIAVRVAKLPMTGVLRARTTGETTGFMKAVIAADSDAILGFAMLGSDASEVIATMQTAMLARLPYTALREAIFAHPTMTEGLGNLFGRVPRRS